jgi:uncharacterized membrane protein HdeD (DUF308 family)
MDSNIVMKDIREEIRAHRLWYIIEGVFFFVIGFLAILLPNTTAITTTLLLGALLFFGGLLQISTFFRYPRRRWKALSAILFMIAGLVVAFVPLVGLLTLTVLIAVVLMFESLFEITFSLAFKPFPGWKWMMFSGIVTLLLALIILIGFPETTTLFLAIAVGLNMGLYGMSILLLVFGKDK